MMIYVTPDDNLQKILDAAPENAVIRLSGGVWRQKCVIRTNGLTILGQGPEKTRIVYDDYANKEDGEGFRYITFRTYTLAVCADHVTMENLSVINDAGQPEKKGQQIALSVCGDDFTMKNCRLTSTQDTLFLGPLPEDLIERYDGFLPEELRRGGIQRQRFVNCRITGTVDFIFGGGSALFEGCELRSGRDARSKGFVAAPSHSREQAEGFRFQGCSLTREEGVADGSVYLARPWRDYGMARFENCVQGPHIAPEGFDPWAGTRRDKTARFYESPPVPGRVTWVNRQDTQGQR